MRVAMFQRWFSQAVTQKLILGLAILALSSVASLPAVAADGQITGIRGPAMTLYDAQGGSEAGSLSRREGRKFRDEPLAYTGDGEWLQIKYNEKDYWILREQAQISSERPEISCTAKLGGSSAGASRGIGEGCKK